MKTLKQFHHQFHFCAFAKLHSPKRLKGCILGIDYTTFMFC